ncbi:serine O-acetyltransferase [Zhouia amylolytica]|uniref:Serine acetyltransferase n=2 Tax=Zhouia amylolytica TaxID=376730 RepID=W2URW8_9FLAO|nr:serine acetyltransferase [Zhouia amylolytica]ETN96216.1 serine O-acetyltransferase [Zhouia amylolytica AD3]MCQ0112282.1 serine acetyltransferase [Zhouia amylolytica]SFT14196.1 serine O-acetyltransferase [Zhouia amylolytica]
MIDSKRKYKEYLDCDKNALGLRNHNAFSRVKEFMAPNAIWGFQKLLRKVEYYKNCKKGPFNRVYYYYLKYRFRKRSMRLGFSIPENVFGPGLAIVHYGTIVINSNAKVGANCRIHACTNIGASGGNPEAPQLGNNVYIAPGAKIYGNINIANNIAIGANAVVHKSFEEEGILIAGNPAKKIKDIDIKRIIKHI